MRFNHLFLFIIALPRLAWAGEPDRDAMPILLGPQYPLLYRSTTFEPDSAFPLKPGTVFASFGYSVLNTYVRSNNSDRVGNPSGDPSKFDEIDSTGYSLYFDGEIDRRFQRWYWGFSKNVELQFTFRQLRFIRGSLDSTIEDFHSSFGLGNQGREEASQNDLGIYIHDNETGKNVFQITQSSDEFQQESITLGFKWALRRTNNEAIAFVANSNFGDRYIERELNEINTAFANDHANFDDSNLGLIYSGLYSDWALHAAFSFARAGRSLLEKSPEEIYYFFLGANWKFTEHSRVFLQTLEYSSPYPRETISTIGADVREVTLAMRWLIGKGGNLEMGLIQNQSQGPQNIDILFFSTVGVHF